MHDLPRKIFCYGQNIHFFFIQKICSKWKKGAFVYFLRFQNLNLIETEYELNEFLLLELRKFHIWAVNYSNII